MSMYTKFFRPLFFTLDVQVIHAIVAKGGEFVARVPVVGHAFSSFYRVRKPELATTVDGNTFESPIGLSAGFDKDGEFANFAYMFGFGHMEIGSVTGGEYEGNEGKHVRRLVKNESLIINYGLKSEGAKSVYHRVSKKKIHIPFGISAAKTNRLECAGQKAIDDYAHVYETFARVGDWHTINLSCPNTVDGTPFSDPENLRPLLERLSRIRKEKQITQPMYVKVNPDIPRDWMDHIIILSNEFFVDGFIIGNLIKDNTKAKAFLQYPEEYDESLPGHLSGTPTKQLSLDLIRYVRRKVGDTKTIIGCGGVFTGQDAYDKIKAGANLIQMITGFIFRGPATIRTINLELAELLQKDGLTSIEQAVGKEDEPQRN